MKAVLKSGVEFVNVKRVSDSKVIAAIRWLKGQVNTVSDAVYGNENGGFISGFSKIYKADGTVYGLGQSCYASITNLVLTNDIEPGTPIPDPIPVPSYPPYLIATFPDGVAIRYDISQPINIS